MLSDQILPLQFCYCFDAHSLTRIHRENKRTKQQQPSNKCYKLIRNCEPIEHKRWTRVEVERTPFDLYICVKMWIWIWKQQLRDAWCGAKNPDHANTIWIRKHESSTSNFRKMAIYGSARYARILQGFWISVSASVMRKKPQACWPQSFFLLSYLTYVFDWII